MMFQRGNGFSNGGIVILLFMGFLVQNCLTRIFVSCGDHMYDLSKKNCLIKYVVISKKKTQKYVTDIIPSRI
jgi:hypothetical protein